ncbi:hypothetical protein HAX54_033278 [Datura stramonium]|uniref:Uncharacterized protein n=1 Tax=Datura stramonium TaxID=4076 RepID=A0ABS8VFH9_DATST|nr:hypothetical protein [Datura stramonium]
MLPCISAYFAGCVCELTYSPLEMICRASYRRRTICLITLWGYIGGIVSNTLRPPVPESCDADWKSLLVEDVGQRAWRGPALPRSPASSGDDTRSLPKDKTNNHTPSASTNQAKVDFLSFMVYIPFHHSILLLASSFVVLIVKHDSLFPTTNKRRRSKFTATRKQRRLIMDGEKMKELKEYSELIAGPNGKTS